MSADPTKRSQAPRWALAVAACALIVLAACQPAPTGTTIRVTSSDSTSVGVSSDGTFVLVTERRWDPVEGQSRSRRVLKNTATGTSTVVTPFSFTGWDGHLSPDGRVVTWASHANPTTGAIEETERIYRWSRDTGTGRVVASGPTETFRLWAVSSNSRYLVVEDGSGPLAVVDALTGARRARVDLR